MENDGSIPMYFEATNRLQPLALPQNHHLTTPHHRILTENPIPTRVHGLIQNMVTLFEQYFLWTRHRLQPLNLHQNHRFTHF